MSALDQFIANAIAEHKAIEAEKERAMQEAWVRVRAAECAKVRAEVEGKLTPELRAALEVDYAHGTVEGYHRNGYEGAYALLTVDGETCWLLCEFSSEHANIYYWTLVTPNYARYRVVAQDTEHAQRNLLLAIHEYQTGEHLREA